AALRDAIRLARELDRDLRARNRCVRDDRTDTRALEEWRGLDGGGPVRGEAALQHHVPALVIAIVVARVGHRVVEENGDAAEETLGVAHHLPDVAPVCDVRVAEVGAPSHRSNLAHELLTRTVLDVGDEHVRAFGGEALRRRCSDARSPTGHDRRPPVEPSALRHSSLYLPSG